MIEPIMELGEVAVLLTTFSSDYQAFTSPEDSSMSPSGVVLKHHEMLLVVAVKRCMDRDWALVLSQHGAGWVPNNNYVLVPLEKML